MLSPVSPPTCATQDLPSHLPGLRRFARKLTRSREHADDLVQDTVERALRHAHSFKPGTDLRKWLFKIMYNAFLNHVTIANRMPCISIGDYREEDFHLARLSPESQWAELHDLRYALALLHEDQRQLISMVAIECMTYENVARTLDIPVGTVMSRLSRARRRLRKLMTGDQRGMEGCQCMICNAHQHALTDI
jgi:RNA polymerase sigma-70 factor, ECF subfamily